MLGPQFVESIDLSRQMGLLENATDMVVTMIRELRKGVNLERIRTHNDQLQADRRRRGQRVARQTQGTLRLPGQRHPRRLPQGHLRTSRKSRRPLPRRRQRHQPHRPQEFVTGLQGIIYDADSHRHTRCAHLRVHQRLPRHRQLHRDRRLHQSAHAASGDHPGRRRRIWSGALLGTAVAKTISSGLLDSKVFSMTNDVLICALLGGIIWNLITWYFGLPSSSSHALIGGLCGARSPPRKTTGPSSSGPCPIRTRGTKARAFSGKSSFPWSRLRLVASSLASSSWPSFTSSSSECVRKW